MATIVEGNPKAPFSIATTPRCRGGRYSKESGRKNTSRAKLKAVKRKTSEVERTFHEFVWKPYKNPRQIYSRNYKLSSRHQTKTVYKGRTWGTKKWKGLDDYATLRKNGVHKRKGWKVASSSSSSLRKATTESIRTTEIYLLLL